MPDSNKIGFVIHGLPMGGAEKFLINIINYFNTQKHDCILVLLSDQKTLLPELTNAVKVFTVLKKSRLDLSVSKRIKAILDQEQVTKIFCVNTYAFFLTKLAYRRDKKMPFYLSLHSTIPATRKNYWQNYFYFKVLTKYDRVIYLCNNQKQYLEKAYRFTPGHDRIVYNGINTNYFDPTHFVNEDLLKLRQSLQLKANDEIIIQVTRLQEEKGHITSIEALEILHGMTGKKQHLLIIGSGEEAYITALKKLVTQKNLAQYVHFVGNQKDVRPYYMISNIFTLTSFSIETFSLAALEAMAFGLPCSLTNIGGASEMVVTGKTGILTKPKNPESIAQSWKILLEGAYDKNAIRQYVLDNFTADKMLKAYEQILT